MDSRAVPRPSGSATDRRVASRPNAGIAHGQSSEARLRHSARNDRATGVAPLRNCHRIEPPAWPLRATRRGRRSSHSPRSIRNSACSTRRRSCSIRRMAVLAGTSRTPWRLSRAISNPQRCWAYSNDSNANSGGGRASAGVRASARSRHRYFGAEAMCARAASPFPILGSINAISYSSRWPRSPPTGAYRGSLTARHLAHRLARRRPAR